MTDKERLEYIKILHDEANEIGKNDEKDAEEKIIDILRRLFYQAHTDFLIVQADRVETLVDRRVKDIKFVSEIKQENQRYKQALEDALWSLKTFETEDAKETIEKALKGDSNG